MAPLSMPTDIARATDVLDSMLAGTDIPTAPTQDTPAQGPVNNLPNQIIQTPNVDQLYVDAVPTGGWANEYRIAWDNATTAATNTVWANGTAGWYTAKISYGANGVYTTDLDGVSIGPKRIEPRVKKKILLLDRPYMAVMKKPQIAQLGDDNGEQPISVDVEEIKHSRVIRQGRNKKYEFEVYEVPNDDGYIDTVYRKECLEGRGLRETGGGFFVFDPEVRSRFRFSKMVELKQAPSYISSRSRLQNKMLAPNEIIARDLLRRYVGDKEFKRYLKFGYICMAAHGFMWRVPGENATIGRVEQYQKDRLLHSYCVHFADPNIPPTDACIMRMALVSAGVDVIASQSNVSRIDQPARRMSLIDQNPPAEPRSRIITSLDAYRSMKKELCLN